MGTRFKDMKSITGTRNTTGDGTAILAALATGQRRVIVGYQIQVEGAAAQIVTLKSGSTVKYRLNSAADAYAAAGPFFFPDGYGWTMGNAEALYLNLTAAELVNYIFWYLDDAE